MWIKTPLQVIHICYSLSSTKVQVLNGRNTGYLILSVLCLILEYENMNKQTLYSNTLLLEKKNQCKRELQSHGPVAKWDLQ